MRDSNDKVPVKAIAPTLFSQTCQCGNFAPHIHPDEALVVHRPCVRAFPEDIVTCRDALRDRCLDEVRGLGFENVKLHKSTGRLPEFIPIVPHDLFELHASELPNKTVGVTLNDILTQRLSGKNGRLRLPPGSRINHEVLHRPVFAGKNVILFSTGQDILIETLWWKRHRLHLFETISEMGFFAVTGMNFSVFTGECPFGHALNLKKSLCYCEGLDQLRVRTMPHVYAINRFQRERWRDWLLINPKVSVITINAQLQRKQSEGMTDVIDTTRYLLEHTGVRVIIHGSAKRAATLAADFPHRLHFAASGPLKRARFMKHKSLRAHIDHFRRSYKRVEAVPEFELFRSRHAGGNVTRSAANELFG